MANTASNLEYFPAITDFVSGVEKRSGGNVRIELVNEWGGFAADAEQQVVRAVATGQVDLGHAGTRGFDTMGVTSFQALQAPMLIDSYALERAVVEGEIPQEMLHGLDRVGVAGLGVLGGGLSKPIAVEQPLLGSADWHGITFGTYRSEAQAQAIRSLGGTPVEVFGKARDQELQDGKLQAFELNLLAYKLNVLADDAPYVTANVNLWPWTDVLFANPGRLAALTGQQRGWLQQAAADAVGRSVGLVDRDAESVAFTCKSGARFANASEADLAGLGKAVAPVYAKLKDDPQTKAFIERIQALKRSTPVGAALRIPAGCTGVASAAPAAAQQQGSGDLSGTYRWTLTKDDVAASTTEDKSPEHLATFPWVFTMTLDGGEWTLAQREVGQPSTEGPGTYALDGDRLSFTWPQEGSVLTFTVVVDGKGTSTYGQCSPWTPVTSSCGRRTRGPGSTDAARSLRRLAAEWDLGGEARPLPGNARHLERPADGLDPVGKPPQAGTASWVGATHPVVLDLHPDQAVASRHGNGDAAGAGVLGDVGKGLGADEIGDHRHRRGHPVTCDRDLDGNREVLGQHRQGARQPALGQQARMQALCQPAQLLQRQHELGLGAADLFPGLLAGGGPSALAQRVRQLAESPLRPLAQATLQPPAFVIPRHKDPSA